MLRTSAMVSQQCAGIPGELNLVPMHALHAYCVDWIQVSLRREFRQFSRSDWWCKQRNSSLRIAMEIFNGINVSPS